MNAKVDLELCIGCGLCPQTAPEVFEVEGDKVKVKTNPVPPDAEASVKEAAENCPVNAITVE